MKNKSAKCYFVTGTGRNGTKLFSTLFSLSKKSLCEHEKIFRHESMLRFYRDNDFDLYLEDISNALDVIKLYNISCKSYGISSAHLCFSIPYLYSIFGNNVRFILSVRQPDEFTRSALARGFFDPEHPHACIQLLPKQKDKIYKNWSSITPLEKNLWYWQVVNGYVAEEFQKIPNDIWKIVFIENVDQQTARELCDFVGLDDISNDDIARVLSVRINASPAPGERRDVNPYSNPIKLVAKDGWKGNQLSLLNQYTMQLHSELNEQSTNKNSNAKILPPFHDLPTVILDLHSKCNQTCDYCVAKTSTGNDFGPISDESKLAKIQQFFANEGPFNILLTGGEPLITPGLPDLLTGLVSKGHLISMQSNLKSKTEHFIYSVPPEKVGWILSTFHSSEIKSFDNYLKKVLDLKTRGYPIIVKLILDNTMLKEFVGIYEKLKMNSIGTVLSPLVIFPNGRDPYPRRYTSDEWKMIASRITLLSSWLYFAGGWRSREALCRAGEKVLYISARNGQVSGCAHSYPANLGNVYENRFEPKKKPVKCGLDICICDFNYYSGLIPEVNDSWRFNKLIKGTMESVPFSLYKLWIKQSGINPVNDLENDISIASPLKRVCNLLRYMSEKINRFNPGH